MTKSRNKRAVGLGLICLVVAGWWLKLSSLPVLPAATVTTIVRLHRGPGPGELGKTTGWEHKGAYYRLAPLVAPAAVDDSGNFYAMDLDDRLTVVGQGGKSVHQYRCQEQPQAIMMAVGTRHALWMAGVVDKTGCWWRLIRADDQGGMKWELGECDPQLQVVRFAPTLPRPPRYDGGHIINEADGLFADKTGSVYVYDDYGTMRRFDEFGRSAGSYDLKPQDAGASTNGYVSTGWAAVVSRSGTVYAYHLGTLSGDFTQTLLLDIWPDPSHHRTQSLDMSRLRCPGEDALLRGTDAKENLYFEYRYEVNGADPGDSWGGPMAIARVGPDGVAREILDIYSHYRAEQTTGSPDGSGYIGDLVSVGPKGELYLEYLSGGDYCVDKITVPG